MPPPASPLNPPLSVQYVCLASSFVLWSLRSPPANLLLQWTLIDHRSLLSHGQLGWPNIIQLHSHAVTDHNQYRLAEENGFRP